MVPKERNHSKINQYIVYYIKPNTTQSLTAHGISGTTEWMDSNAN